jgi:predicted transcriptional regulator
MLARTAPWKVVAKEVMHADVITVRDDMTVQEVAAFLIENQISGAPVEDGEGRLVKAWSGPTQPAAPCFSEECRPCRAAG